MELRRPCPRCRTLRPPATPCPCCDARAELPAGEPLGGARDDVLLRAEVNSTPLEGTLVGEASRALVGRELRDKLWQLLARVVELEVGALALEHQGEHLPLVGPVIVTRVVEHRPIDSARARALCALDPRLALPPYLLRVETAVFVGEAVAVRGKVVSAGEAGTYRQMSLSRRFVGEVGRPLVIGLSSAARAG